MGAPTDDEFQRYLAQTARGMTWDARHQLYLFERLRHVTSKRGARLMIFMPPRHGKSEMVTIRYAAWRIEKDPSMNIILGCYNQKLANRFSRRIRRIVGERLELAKDLRSADEWETRQGGGVKAVGVGAGITGFGASLVIIDDPVKGRAESESLTRRDNVWDWYNDDIATRLEPGASVIVIQTRWHQDDLAGRLLDQAAELGDEWEVVCLPALAEADDPLGRAEGEALWPERFDADYFERLRLRQGSYSFASLYQQQPIPREGAMFKRAWFERFVDKPPEGLRWARGYDLAVSTAKSADHTASFRCALGPDGDLYIADGYRKRIEYPEQRRFVLGRMGTERATMHGVESALHGLALVQDLKREAARSRGLLREVRVDTDKFTRALAWAPLAEAGKVVLVRGGWNRDLIDELCAFPAGRYDDQVDAVSLAFAMLHSAYNNKFLTFK